MRPGDVYVDSEIGRLYFAAVFRPGIEIHVGSMYPKENLFIENLDAERGIEEFKNYVTFLENCGISVHCARSALTSAMVPKIHRLMN